MAKLGDWHAYLYEHFGDVDSPFWLGYVDWTAGADTDEALRDDPAYRNGRAFARAHWVEEYGEDPDE